MQKSHGDSRLDHIFSKLFEFRLGGVLCDIEFKIGSKTFLAHKLVLSASSEYFQTMFLGGMSEQTQSSIQLHEIPPEIFEELLDFTYGKDLSISSENAEDLIVTADMLQFQDAVELCTNYMKNQLDCSNCIGLYCFAKQHAFEDLQMTSWDFILSHFYQLVLEEEFLASPLDVISSLVCSEQITISSESEVMHSVLKWLSYNVRERRKYCVSLFKNVRINLIPPSEFDKILLSCNDVCLKIAVKVLSQNLSMRNIDCCTGKAWEPRQSAKKSFYAVGGCIPKNSRRYTWEDSNFDAVSFVERFDSFNKTWDPYTLSLREARMNLAVVEINRKIYMIGGEKDSMIYGSMECYDTFQRRWVWDLPALNIPRTSCQAVATDKEIYILGGYVGSGAGNSIEKYTIDSNTCELVNFTMQTERHSFGAACYQNVIYMAGGIGLSECELRTVECYDLSRHEWWFAKDMHFKRAYFSLVCLNGLIYAIGGFNEHQGALKTVEVYDTYKNYWKLCTPMREARAGAFVAVMDKKIIVVGGKMKTTGRDGETTWKMLDSAEVFDPVMNTWDAFEELNFDARCDGAATVV